ncbi:MAG TPA: tetraacyldisaccharide 4'-kinase [Candidatus Hydrogenedentes bacterium]|nr:tetraacyldisaccharide 4'-kinase [Candidatus Hydrogenedentota bacterium]
MKDTLSDRIRRGDTIDPPLSWLLSGATIFTRAGMGIRRMRPFAAVDADVISIGNITAGGTGKTPAVIRYAKRGVAAGVKVGVLTRGHGTRQSSSVVVSSDIEPEDHFRLLGDEPALILRKVPEALVFKGKDRVQSAQIAVQDHGCQVLILDDGYQYIHLGRNDDILMIDSTNPFGNGRLLPRGFLREPLSDICRATHCIVTRCDEGLDRSEISETVQRYNPGCAIEWTVHSPTALIHADTDVEQSLDLFSGKDVIAACAIGNPESFTKTLESLGMNVIESHAFADHERIPQNVLKSSHPAIITEKDAVRIQSPPDNVFAVGIELETLPD